MNLNIILSFIIFLFLIIFNRKYEKFINTKPEACALRGFTGDKSIKITWIEPESIFDIKNYYLIIYKQNAINDFVEIHSILNDRINHEYIIDNLENNTIYDIVMIANNSQNNLSEISNIISLIPIETKKPFNNFVISKYDNSLENTRENNKYKKQREINEKQKILQNLKHILVNNLNFNLDETSIYNINIY